MSIPIETRPNSQQLFERHPGKDILYGSLAGIISKLFEHPFDLVKVRLQTQPVNLPSRYNGPLDCFRLTFTQEGFRGLYRGVSMPVVGAMLENATLFLVYGQVQQILRRIVFPEAAKERKPAPLPLPYVAFAAACGGAMASFILTPIELVKCRMQVQQIATTNQLITPSAENKPPKLKGPVGIVRSVLKNQGLTGLWLGQTGTLLRETGGSAIWFCSFETVAGLFISRREKIRSMRDTTQFSPAYERMSKDDLTSSELMFAGATAGLLYNVMFFPADSIKSTIQTASELQPDLQASSKKSLGGKQSFIQVGRQIVRSRGWKALYAGCGITCLKSAPSSALIFWIVSRLESRFG